MSIGAVARATGIPANTLRTWERRYGFPSPVRTEGGQRLYSAAVLSHLRSVARALGLGHRPREVLALSPEALAALLARTTGPVPSQHGVPDHWMAAVERLDGTALDLALERAHARMGVLEFLETGLGPFVEQLGERWASGGICVHHEHFATGRVEAFLWRARARVLAEGVPIVCAALPGERHTLGLQMAAWVLALAGRRVVFLGADTPVDDIVGNVAAVGADAVVISVPRGGDAAPLVDLRARLTPRCALLAGGAGAPGDLSGVDHPGTLTGLYDWASA